jgi:hypothetical protein
VSGEERVWADRDCSEVAVRPGALFRAGDVVLSAYDLDGTGASAYLRPSQAREVAAALLEAADEADAADPSPAGSARPG